MNYSDKEKTSLNDNELYFAKVLKYIRLAWFPILLCYLEFTLGCYAPERKRNCTAEKGGNKERKNLHAENFDCRR